MSKSSGLRAEGIYYYGKFLLKVSKYHQSTVIKASSDLRNVSSMTEVKMYRKIHTMDPHMLRNKIIPLQAFRSICSSNNWQWVLESVTADG